MIEYVKETLNCKYFSENEEDKNKDRAFVRGQQIQIFVKIISLPKRVYSFNIISLNIISFNNFSLKINKIIQNSCLNTKGLR